MNKIQSTLRSLWLKCDFAVPLTDQVGIPIPKNLVETTEESLHLLIEKLQDSKHNAVMLGFRSRGEGEEENFASIDNGIEKIREVEKKMKEKGIKLILKPHFHGGAIPCPVDPNFEATIKKKMALFTAAVNPDYIFWESGLWDRGYFAHAAADDLLLADLVVQEMKSVETVLKKGSSLIFFVPGGDRKKVSKTTKILQVLCESAGNKTAISFPAVGGAEYADYLPPHPFWGMLKEKERISSTPLLPVMNIGGIEQGEGMWPSLPFDLFEKYYCRLHELPFKGSIGLINQLPVARGFLDLNLWTGSHCQLSGKPPRLLIEEWFGRYRTDVDYSAFQDDLWRLRMMILDFSSLLEVVESNERGEKTNEEIRLFLENLVSQAKYWDCYLAKMEKSQKIEDSFLGTPLLTFLRDLRRLLPDIAQKLGVSLPFRWT